MNRLHAQLSALVQTLFPLAFLTLAFLTLALLSLASPAVAEDGFRSIFNGRDLSGWSGNEEFWGVEDGAITGQTSSRGQLKSNTFLIWNQGVVDDFELKLKYRIENGNSGIQYRSLDYGNFVVAGPQADLEAGDTWSGAHYEERGRGTLARRGEVVEVTEEMKDGKEQTKIAVVTTLENPAGPSLQSHVKKEDWNEYHIIARGNRMIHKINGVVMSDVTDYGEDSRDHSGILALQLHVGPAMKVQFKDIQLKRLPMANKKKVVFVAGKDSHRRGSHEHSAGCHVLAAALNENMPEVQATIYKGGWPADPTAFDNADTIVMFADGGDRHPVMNSLEQVEELNKKGVGVVCIHYGVEVPKGPASERFLDWIGGFFEKHWSVNPVWKANYKEMPEHPISRGVGPFTLEDEWYYHMRFRDGMEGITPILSAVPPKESLSRPDGPHTGNPNVRAAVDRGEIQHTAWASEREGRGRGFGFTGAHFHRNWANENFRKVVLNAITWTAGAEVPQDGVSSASLSEEDLDSLLPKTK